MADSVWVRLCSAANASNTLLGNASHVGTAHCPSNGTGNGPILALLPEIRVGWRGRKFIFREEAKCNINACFLSVLFSQKLALSFTARFYVK